MIIDISSYNGKIDFREMAHSEEIERVILRGTTKNGNLDTRFIENMNGVLSELNDNVAIDVYKFSYARNYADACVEVIQLLEILKTHGVLKMINNIWLDIEPFDNREHTTGECSAIIAAYIEICRIYGVEFGIYCNYSYLKNIVPKWAQNCKIWLARWGGSMGKCEPFNVVLWQYTNKGQCAGIAGDVDLSRAVR